MASPGSAKEDLVGALLDLIGTNAGRDVESCSLATLFGAGPSFLSGEFEKDMLLAASVAI